MNTAVARGDEARFNCSAILRDDVLEWRHYFAPSSPGGDRIYVSSSGQVSDERFRVLTGGDGRHDLVLKTAERDLAGRYTCRLLITDVSVQAELVVLGETHKQAYANTEQWAILHYSLQQ